MNKFLDKAGLSYLWSKIAENFSEIPKCNTVTLEVSAWSNNQQTVTVNGILDDETKQIIHPTPSSASKEAYDNAGISCVSQATNSLTFSCKEVPSTNLTVYVVVQEVQAA